MWRGCADDAALNPPSRIWGIYYRSRVSNRFGNGERPGWLFPLPSDGVCVYRGASARAPGCVRCTRGGWTRWGTPVERRKIMDPKVPIGTTESNPRFQPWVASRGWPEPRRGDRKDGNGPVRSFVPDGTRLMFALQPSDKSLGSFRASLRDVESRRAKHVPDGRGLGSFCWKYASCPALVFAQALSLAQLSRTRRPPGRSAGE